MIRNDITVNWAASPRIITVAAPSVEVSMQDLRDTLRWLEMSDTGMLYPPLLESSGKQNLGGGVMVGLTIKLLNAKVAFEARGGPDWTLCSLAGGNCVAVDANGDAMDVRAPTAYTSVDRVSSSSATLVEPLGQLAGIPRGIARMFSVGLAQDGLEVTAVLSKDAGTFNALTNAVVGKGNRQYVLSLTAAEMDAVDLYLLLTADGMNPIPITLQTSG